ncbi:MAG: cupredoxin domain-containing protein [Iamia sp.]
MSISSRITPLVLAGLTVVAVSCGSDEPNGAPANGSDGAVEVRMVDIAYEPTSLEASVGDTVRFVFTNEGNVAHDAFIGDEAAQAAHESEMRSMDGMDGMEHSGDDGITVAPGESAELTHTFSEAGPRLIGCHEPGHYEGGMVIDVDVV